MRILILISLIFGSPLYTLGQISYFGDISTGYFILDANPNPSDKESKYLQTYGARTELSIIGKYNMEKNLSSILGLGYMNMIYFDRSLALNINSISSSYLNLKVGFEIASFWKHIDFSIVSSNYLLAHKEKQSRMQNRYFSNIDLGIKFKLNKKIQLYISSPLTIAPLYSGKISITGPLLSTGVFESFVEMNGVMIGGSIRF